MKVRIGIDVGGTFTDAAVIDNETYELIGSEKVPTTHSAATGVAAGIVEVLQAVMQRYNISPDDVAFIAHGTTQATNALLEGDVEKSRHNYYWQRHGRNQVKGRYPDGRNTPYIH